MKSSARRRDANRLERYFFITAVFSLIFLACVNSRFSSTFLQQEMKQSGSVKGRVALPRAEELPVLLRSEGEPESKTSTSIVDSVNDHSHDIDTSISTSAPSSPYAYVWIIGGIHEDQMSFKGFLWDVLISVSLLRNQGSTADFWLYARLSPDSKRETMLAEDERLLHAMGIHIKYLEKPQRESFAQIVHDKFLTINMTDYKRVMFLDADIIPLTNMDYYFHLSDPDYKDLPTVLKPNFIVVSLSPIFYT